MFETYFPFVELFYLTFVSFFCGLYAIRLFYYVFLSFFLCVLVTGGIVTDTVHFALPLCYALLVDFITVNYVCCTCQGQRKWYATLQHILPVVRPPGGLGGFQLRAEACYVLFVRSVILCRISNPSAITLCVLPLLLCCCKRVASTLEYSTPTSKPRCKSNSGTECFPHPTLHY